MRYPMKAFLTVATIVLAQSAATATTTSTSISGGLSGSENSCSRILLLFSGNDCSYGNDQVAPDGGWIGPTISGAYYVVGSAGDSPGYTPLPGDDRISPAINATISIDDQGTLEPGDDLISASWVIDAAARNVAAGQVNRVTERWSGMTHEMDPTPVSAATPNAAGGFDYVIGEQGFPQPICSAADAGDCFPSPNAPFGIPSLPSFWSGFEPSNIGIERNLNQGGNAGARTRATFSGYSCSDLNGIDCSSSLIVWGNPVEVDPGFANLILKITTNSSGQVTGATGYWTHEFAINFGAPPPGDNSWVGGTISFGPGVPVQADARDDTASTIEGQWVTINILGNDTGFVNPVTVTVLNQPANGSVALTGENPGATNQIKAVYSPGPGFFGVDTFTYEITDGTSTDAATVTITVAENLSPVAVDDVAEVSSNSSVFISVLDNDSLGNLPPTVALNSPPGNGTAIDVGNGNFVYIPNSGYLGKDSFSYWLTDADGETVTATVTITISFGGGQVAIDIDPGRFPNNVNLRSGGQITVAILSAPGFDATALVDPVSLKFGPRQASVFGKPTRTDVDRDGDTDLVVRFPIRDTGILCSDTSAALEGSTYDFAYIYGYDSISTVNCPWN